MSRRLQPLGSCSRSKAAGGTRDRPRRKENSNAHSHHRFAARSSDRDQETAREAGLRSLHAAYPIPDTRMCFREWSSEQTSHDGQLGAPFRPVVGFEVPPELCHCGGVRGPARDRLAFERKDGQHAMGPVVLPRAPARARGARRSDGLREPDGPRILRVRNAGAEVSERRLRGHLVSGPTMRQRPECADLNEASTLPPSTRWPFRRIEVRSCWPGESIGENIMNSVVHFEMPFDDSNRMTKFYESAFGWRTQKLGEDMGSYVLATTTETDDNVPPSPGA